MFRFIERRMDEAGRCGKKRDGGSTRGYQEREFKVVRVATNGCLTCVYSDSVLFSMPDRRRGGVNTGIKVPTCTDFYTTNKRSCHDTIRQFFRVSRTQRVAFYRYDHISPDTQ